MLQERSLETPPRAVTLTQGPPPSELVKTHVMTRVLLTNVPWLGALLAGSHLPEPLKPLLAGAVMFVAPGLAWADRRAGDAAVVVFRALIGAFFASAVALVLAALLPGATSRLAFLLLLAAVTNLGLVVGFRRGWYDARPFAHRLTRVLGPLAALFYAQSCLGGSLFIPPLEDQDMELQGTAFGLMHHLSPTMTGMDGSQHYFAHPLLLHFLIGESALISGDLEALRYYHDGTVAMGSPPPPRADFDAWEDASAAQWQHDYEHFMREPHLAATRTPNMWLGALLLFPLGFLVYRLSGSVAAAGLAALLYFTLPEVYVRSAYGGYMALANLLTLFGSYFYLSVAGLLPERDLPSATQRHARIDTFIAAALGGWSDQKNVILIMATCTHAGLRRWLEGQPLALFTGLMRRRDVRGASLVTLGLAVGWVTYVAYGLCVAPEEFIEHHIKGHILDRIAMTDVNLSDVAKGEWTYPSITALWQQFAEHTGWLVMAVATLALTYGVKHIRAAEGVFTLWIALAALGFSLVDWRQTKHLAQFLPALAVLIAVFWATRSGRSKQVLSAVLGAAVCWNIVRIGLLMHDFEYLKPLPIW